MPIERKKQGIRELASRNIGGSVKVGIMRPEVAEYAFYNEFGTAHIPARPFMRMAFEKGKAQISSDAASLVEKVVSGAMTPDQALQIMGQRHADRVKYTIKSVDIPPMLDPETIKRKKGATKTLVDTGVMANSVTFEVEK